MSKSDTHRPGSANKTQSTKSASTSSKKGDGKKHRLSEEKASSRQSKNRGERYHQKNHSSDDRAKEPGRISAENEGLWVPNTEPDKKLYSTDDLVRMRLTWISATLVGVLALAGVAGLVVLLIFQVDTAPLLQFAERVTNYAFVALAFALGYYFRGKHSKKRR